MVTKTMILRPSFTVEVGGAPIPTPDNIDVNDYYKLINEEVADEYATDIKLLAAQPNKDGDFFTFGFNYNKLGTILSSKLSIVASKSNTDSFIQVITILDKNLTICETIEKTIDAADNSGDFKTYEIDLSDINQFLNTLSEGYIHVKFSGYHNNTKTSGVTYITQSYITLEYTEPKILHIKHNDSWISTPINDIYKKDNNLWVLMDFSILQNEQKYIVNFIE